MRITVQFDFDGWGGLFNAAMLEILPSPSIWVSAVLLGNTHTKLMMLV